VASRLQDLPGSLVAGFHRAFHETLPIRNVLAGEKHFPTTNPSLDAGSSSLLPFSGLRLMIGARILGENTRDEVVGNRRSVSVATTNAGGGPLPPFPQLSDRWISF
jgi:hypothetical protein